MKASNNGKRLDESKVSNKIYNWRNDLQIEKPVLYKAFKDTTLFANFFFKDPFDSSRDFVPYRWQDLVFNDDSKRVVVCVARQCGKTTLAAIKALQFAYFHENATVIVVSRTYPQSLEVVDRMNVLMKASAQMTWEQLKPKEKESRAVIKIKNQGKKTFSRILSVPATDASRGYTADLVICDEVAFWEEGDYIFKRVVEPTTSHTRGQIFVISTPNGQQGVFWELFNSPNSSSYQFDWHVDPNITEKEMKSKEEDMTSLEFASEYLGEFVSPKNALFTYPEITAAVSEGCDSGFSGNGPVVVSADFGKLRDQAVILVGTIDNFSDDPKDHVVRVVKRIVKPIGTNYSEVIGELKNLCAIYNPHGLYVDSTGTGDGPAEFLQSEGLPVEGVKFSLQKKSNIYGTLKVLFEQKRIKIPKEKQLLDQLGWMMYEYTVGGSMKIFPPEYKHDDEPDALALLSYGLTNAGLSAASVEIVEKPIVVGMGRVVRDSSISPGSSLVFCDVHDDYHWNGCPPD